MPALIALLLSVPLIVLIGLAIGAVVLLRLVFGRGRSPWLAVLALLFAAMLAVQGLHLAGHLLGPLVLVGAGVLLLRGGRHRMRPVQLGAAHHGQLGASGPASWSHSWGQNREQQFVMPQASRPASRPVMPKSEMARPLTLEDKLRRLPSPAREEALSLHAEATRAVNALDDRTPAPEAYTIRATLSDYLPESVDALLAIPESRRNVPLNGGQTPLELLREQLRLMRAGLERAQAGQSQASAERLLAHKRFLEERFGKKDDFQL